MRVAFYSISLTTRQHVVPVLHSWAAVVVPVRLGLLLRWLGMIVVVPDGNPVQTLLKLDCFVAWDLQDLWDDFVHNAVASIGTQYPDLCLAKYSCLRSSDAWLDDGIFGQFIQYLECGMPLAATSSVTEWIPDPPLFKQKNSIDFGELLILDPQTAFKINAAHESGQWEPVLRIISAKCTFANVKRILLPMNVFISPWCRPSYRYIAIAEPRPFHLSNLMHGGNCSNYRCRPYYCFLAIATPL